MNRIPASAQALINRARAAGAEITEHLVDSPNGPIGHVKIKAPNELRAFLTVFVLQPRLSVGNRQIVWTESSGQITRPAAERVLIAFEREQLAAMHAQLASLVVERFETAPAADELLTCEGCGATYADAMQHTQGEHDQRLREQAEMPATLARVAQAAEAAANAADRRVRNLNHRIVGALIKLALLPDEMPIVIENAWQHIHSTGPIDREAFLRGLDVELQARVAALGIDAWADEAPGERPVRTCTCGEPARDNAYGSSCDRWPLCQS